MLSGARTVKTVVVLNAKGGAGKTTLATNLAGYYASQGIPTVLKDYDPQGSSRDWLKQRAASYAKIHGVDACDVSMRTTLSWQMRLPEGVERMVVDSPASVDLFKLNKELRRADAILVPVMVSPIDIRASAIFFSQLLKHMQMQRCEARLAVVASRVVANSPVNAAMSRIFANLSIPVVARLHQSENYLHGAEQGISLFEMNKPAVETDRQDWAELISWLENDRHSEPSLPPRLAVV